MKKSLILILPILVFAACNREETPRDKFIARTNDQCLIYYEAAHAGDYTKYCKCLGRSLAEQFTDEEIVQFFDGTLDFQEKQISDDFALKCASKMPGLQK